MNEKELLRLWNAKRMQIITAQIAPALVLIAIFVLVAQGTLAEASDAAKYLVIAVAGVTGFLAIVSQYAAIREAQALVVDLAAIKDSSRLAQQVSASSSFLQLTAVAVVGLGLVIFALVTWSVLG
jgi:hypothetical protein